MDAPQSDPAEIRRQAAVLRTAAETIEILAERLDHRVDATDVEGPAAQRFRAAMEDRTRRARRAARELEELSTQLLSGAGR